MSNSINVVCKNEIEGYISKNIYLQNEIIGYDNISKTGKENIVIYKNIINVLHSSLSEIFDECEIVRAEIADDVITITIDNSYGYVAKIFDNISKVTGWVKLDKLSFILGDLLTQDIYYTTSTADDWTYFEYKPTSIISNSVKLAFYFYGGGDGSGYLKDVVIETFNGSGISFLNTVDKYKDKNISFLNTVDKYKDSTLFVFERLGYEQIPPTRIIFKNFED